MDAPAATNESTLAASTPSPGLVWEYQRLVIDGAALLRGEGDGPMARLGRDGWELVVAVPRDRHGYQHEVCLVFKRPRRASPATT